MTKGPCLTQPDSIQFRPTSLQLRVPYWRAMGTSYRR